MVALEIVSSVAPAACTSSTRGTLTIYLPVLQNSIRDLYLPTQFFAERVKEHHYDGIRYSSAMSEGGTNIVLFDSRVVQMTAVRLVRVDAIEVKYVDYDGED
jgi:hypothetical protein